MDIIETGSEIVGNPGDPDGCAKMFALLFIKYWYIGFVLTAIFVFVVMSMCRMLGGG